MRCSVLLLACVSAACARQADLPTSAPAAPQACSARLLTFVSTNDVHGHVQSLPALSALVAHLRERRHSDGGAVVLLDAGDLFQGTLETNLTRGSAVIELYNRVGFDAVALGNHEFDYGSLGALEETLPEDPATSTQDPQGALQARLRDANFPFLSANLVRTDDRQPPTWHNLARSVVLRRAGLKIGVIGALTAETPEVVKRKLLSGLEVTDPLHAVVREAELLRATGVDVVVALTHIGGTCKTFNDPSDLSSCDQNSELFRLVRALPRGLVDVVFGGHRHAAVAHFVGDIPVAQAYWAGRAFSRVDLTVSATGRVVESKVFPPTEICKNSQGENCQPRTYEGSQLQRDEEVARASGEISARLTTIRRRPIGAECDAPLPRSGAQESALSNLFVDLMKRAVPGADIAISNAGSIRAGLPAGPLTFGAIYEAMPFDNRLNVATVSGAELREVLTHHVANLERGVASISGFRVEAWCENGSVLVKLSREDGSPIADEASLTLVTSDFVATGGDKLLPAHLMPRFRDAGSDVRPALIQGMKNLREIRSGSKQLHDPANPRVELAPHLETCGKRNAN